MKRSRQLLTPSVEALLYRGDSPLFHELKLIYADVLGGDHTALSRIASVIKNHTKMDISFLVSECTYPDMSISFVPFDVNNVLRDGGFEKMEGKTFNIDTYQKLLAGGRGGVDSRGAVSGVFTKIPATIVVSRVMLSGGYTADELAAGTLHEVGHLYGYFDMMGRSIATSVLIAQTEHELAKTTDLAHREQIVDNITKVLGFEGLDTTELAKNGQEQTLQLVLVRNTVEKLLGDMGDAKLFGTEVEFLADSYAVRSGAAQPLTSLYLKLAKAGRHVQTTSRLEYVATEAFKGALLVAGMVAPATMVVTGLIAGLCIAAAGSHASDRNTPVERLEAVYADLVAALKDTSLPRELKESLVQDIQFVSGLREQLVKRSTVVAKLWQTLSPSHRRNVKQSKVQQEISKLVNNELFAKAAHLSTLQPAE